tara:strand:- start:760 stop:1437 length:678 start_codon:yes stop_codon:yes gene_type:complete
MRVLVVEDNPDILASIVEYLELKGVATDAIHNGKAALELLEQAHYDLVVLDLGLPGLDGISLCQQLREQVLNPIPVIMLTARDTLEDRLQGFEVGADDYLVKPFALPELYERIKAVLKRSQQQHLRQLQVGELHLDLEQRMATRQGQEISLDRKGYALLELLMQRSPAVVSHDQLATKLWGNDSPDSAALKSHIYRLRQLIDRPFGKAMIQSVPGVGYKLVTDDH